MNKLFTFSFLRVPFSIFYFTLLLILLILLFISGCTIQNTTPQIIHDTVYINSLNWLNKLSVKSVKVDSAYGELTGDKMIDGITAFVDAKETNSRWAVEGYPHYAIFYFDCLVTINKIRINLYKGDKGYTNHIKLYNFSDLIWEGDIGNSLWDDIYLNFFCSMIYLEITGPSEIIEGKTNSWTDIGEVEFYGI